MSETDLNEIGRKALAAMIEIDERRRQEGLAALNARRAWYIAQIPASAAKLALAIIVDKMGLDVYCPRLRTMVAPSARELAPAKRKHRHLFLREKIVSLFPGYYFVTLDLERDPWQNRFREIRVYPLRSADNRPRQVPDSLVEGLRARETNGAIDGDMPVEKLKSFKVGDFVRVNSGPFASFTGTIAKLGDADRINLLIEILGGPTDVDIDISQIERII
jgi:transcription antitermination factor NusG